jgi:hypothetical protein
MRYHWFRQCGLFVGSGVVEASCKSVIGQRLKQAGMHWIGRSVPKEEGVPVHPVWTRSIFLSAALDLGSAMRAAKPR